jgi:uncharacterized protein (TIGR02246 family)
MTTTSRTLSVATPLFFALLIGACDRTSPTEVERTASATSSRMLTPEASNALSGPSAVGDVAGVTALVAAWDAAWNAGDGNAIGATFVNESEFINGRGQVATGAATITANHVASLGGVFKGSHTQGTIRNIVFLTGTTAVVDVYNELTNFKALPPGVLPTKPGLQSGYHKRLVVKRNGVWRTQLMQITSIAPPAI